MKKSKYSVYEVYIGYYRGEVIYVGMGIKGRSSHLNSGVSHLYEANRIHFEGRSIKVVTYLNSMCRELCLDVERNLIEDLVPPWNTVHIKNRESIGITRRVLRKKVEKLPKRSGRVQGVNDTQRELLNYLVDRIDHNCLCTVYYDDLCTNLGSKHAKVIYAIENSTDEGVNVNILKCKKERKGLYTLDLSGLKTHKLCKKLGWIKE